MRNKILLAVWIGAVTLPLAACGGWSGAFDGS